jgi:multiple sugar transport system substrate-binding protein
MMTMTTRRRYLATIGVAAAGSALAACGPAGSGGGESGSGTSAGPVTLTLWDRTTSEGYQPFVDAWLPKFNQKYSGKITLQYEPRPDSWNEKLTTAIVAGTPPDLAAVYGTWFRDAQEKGQVIALDKFIKAAKLDADDFVQGIYKAMNIHGNQVGVPQYINTNTVYYNKEVFKRVGVALPAENWTQDQFLDAAQKLTRGPLDRRETWGLSLSFGSITDRVISLCWGAGAQYNDPKNPDVFTFNQPANVKALQWVHDLIWRHRLVARSNDDRGGLSQDDAFLTAGSVAMVVDGTHKIASAQWKQSSTAGWDIAGLPKGPGGRGERLSMDGYAIPQGAKHADASWTAIQEITSKEANKMRAEIMGYLPARKSQFESWTSALPDKRLKSALPSDEARVGPDNVWPQAKDVTDAVNVVWKKVFSTNEVSVQDGLKQMHEAVVGIMGPQGVK